MGAEPIIVYRRTRDKMPAHDFEIEEAIEEGVMIRWLSMVIKQAGDNSITIEKDGTRRFRLSAADRRVSRRWKPTRSSGSRSGR